MAGGLGRRARTPEEMMINMMALAAGDHPGHRSWAPPSPGAPRDVFIACWGKSGTTMMQQMFHQIRMAAATGAGDMDFDDISRMTPWEDTALVLDLDMTADQRAQPRGFKSHREYERLPAGHRYVVTLRDPKECYVSFYRFFDGWHIERGALSMEHFWPLYMSGGPGGCDYFTHLLSWWARRDAADSLVASYRWAAKNRRAMIVRLAGFIGASLDPAQVDLVEQMTSREFMHAHKDRFDDAMMCAVMEAKLGIPADSDSTKVQATGSDAATLPPTIADRIDALWAERVAPATGHPDFASLSAELDAR
ncbi:sulfotransferase domain-containing protein [Parerythrobacter lacustris]|uniref:Sulfotransferase domain-containing protein n=1 Tax=Parerythrobacter lacustris TaxID=2969984 RepID=A0ABT1XMU4_9SPHN|nr:sulfotransferase domain-containing protein [Parerythrobacter lacustris]MCR2832589.1 sulfotransferase domain-containing protein [Parerythrobacter lacustris]